MFKAAEIESLVSNLSKLAFITSNTDVQYKPEAVERRTVFSMMRKAT